MDKNKSALLSAGTEKQGKSNENNMNLPPNEKNCKPFSRKSSEVLDSEYLANTFTRFKLQGFAQRILSERTLISQNCDYRKCHRVTIGGSVVSLVRNPETRRGYYNNVVTCGNSMCCPVCSPRIMGKRSAEIKRAVHEWLGYDPLNTCYMITLTFAHTINDSLKDLLAMLRIALIAFWANGSIKRQLKFADRVGRITATEIQYSQINGWHPHQHILLFCKRFAFDVEELRRHWINALISVGLTGVSDIALNLIEARSAECYLTKISSEMALGNLKQGRGTGHYSPMELLFEAASGVQWATDRFCELFMAVRGLHSLAWSRGLKKLFGIIDCSDSEIADGSAQPELQKFMYFAAEFFSRLPTHTKALLRNHCSTGNHTAAQTLLDKLGIPWFPADFDFASIEK